MVLSLSSLAADKARKDEILMPEVSKNEFVSHLKEMEIEQKLAGSIEVQKCFKENKYEKDKTTSSSANDFVKVDDCFKRAIGRSGKAQVEDLASKLGLQEYNLVQSTNMKEVTTYLSDRLYKSMTGIDRKEQNIEKMIKQNSFKNRKMVDQRDFLDLYKTQLTKNALFEISRFCFVNFRKNSGDDSSFYSHWESFFQNPKSISMKDVNDSGIKPLGSSDKEFLSKDKTEIYQGIANSLGTAALDKFDPKLLGEFFNLCTVSIDPLCDDYEREKKGLGNACLTKDRLRKIRKAISDTAKVIEEMDKGNANDGTAIALDGVQFYDRGAKDKSNSIDSLTNISSADLLSVTSKNEDLEVKCSNSPEDQECEKFAIIGDIDKTKYQVGLEIGLKKEIEIKKLTELKEDKQKLREYLVEQGYFDLVTKLDKDGTLAQGDIDNEIKKVFDAKRDATIAAIDKKLSTRQLADEKNTNDLKIKAEAGAKDAKSEKARLAQVVLFNNIISSHIKLSKKDGDKDVDLGRNLNAEKVEFDGQKTADVDDKLFENLRDKDKPSSKTASFDTVEVGSLFDAILGKDEKAKSP